MINDIKNEKIYENKIFFINGYRISNKELIKILKKEDLTNLQIVIFKENEFSENEIKEFNKIKIINLPLESLQKEDYKINIQNQKITLNKKEFEKKIAIILENNLIEIEDLLTQRKLSDNDLDDIKNLSYELLFLFKCSNSGFFEMEMNALYPQDYYLVKKIIEEKYVSKGVISIKEEKYIRFIGNQTNFNTYYKYKENSINNEIKKKVLEQLFGFYAYTFRYLIDEAKKRNRKEIKVKKYKPNKSLFSFSAIQELGIWLPFKQIKSYNFTGYRIDSIIGYFMHLLRNFKKMFKNKNIFFCMNNIEIWKNVQDYIEDISITLPTLLKMCQCDDSILISLIKQVIKKEDKYLHPSHLRFQLFETMSFEFNEHQKNNLENLEKIEYEFKKRGCYQGELETLFAKCIVNFRENDWKIFDSLKKKILEKIDELRKNNYTIDNKEKFLILFENKVKYKYIKYKIHSIKKLECGILSENELKNLKEILKVFQKNNNSFYFIKTCFLISEWYLKKYKYHIRNGSEDNNDNEKNHIYYLNFGLYISANNKEKIFYFDYAKDFIKAKFKYEKQNNSKIINEEVKKLCKEYEIKYDKNYDKMSIWFVNN